LHALWLAEADINEWGVVALKRSEQEDVDDFTRFAGCSWWKQGQRVSAGQAFEVA
jgi:hypothetical protein